MQQITPAAIALGFLTQVINDLSKTLPASARGAFEREAQQHVNALGAVIAAPKKGDETDAASGQPAPAA